MRRTAVSGGHKGGHPPPVIGGHVTSIVAVFAVVSLLNDGLPPVPQIDLFLTSVVGGAVGVRLQPKGVRSLLLVAPDVHHASVNVEREHQGSTSCDITGAALRLFLRRISGPVNGRRFRLGIIPPRRRRFPPPTPSHFRFVPG